MSCAEPAYPAGAAPVALVDLGDTLCDCSSALQQGLARLRGPDERADDEQLPVLPPHLEARRRLLMAAAGFWATLPALPLGLELLGLLRDEGFAVNVVTKGPQDAPGVWADKVAWCRQHLPGVPVVVTDDKALVQGDVLVDDWLPYVAGWQQRHPRGLAIVPAQPWNADIPNRAGLVRYDGRNRPALLQALRACRRAAASGPTDPTESDPP